MDSNPSSGENSFKFDPILASEICIRFEEVYANAVSYTHLIGQISLNKLHQIQLQ